MTTDPLLESAGGEAWGHHWPAPPPCHQKQRPRELPRLTALLTS